MLHPNRFNNYDHDEMSIEVNIDTVHPGHHSSRLKGYDYRTGGAYFITIVAFERQFIFSTIKSGEAVLADRGRIAEQCWLATVDHFAGVTLLEYVFMPNHFHGLLLLPPNTDTWKTHQRKGTLPGSLSSVVQAFKSATTRRINQAGLGDGQVWQPGFIDHVIRDENDLYNHRMYILNNPRQWELDRENPNRRT